MLTRCTFWSGFLTSFWRTCTDAITFLSEHNPNYYLVAPCICFIVFEHAQNNSILKADGIALSSVCQCTVTGEYLRKLQTINPEIICTRCFYHVKCMLGGCLVIMQGTYHDIKWQILRIVIKSSEIKAKIHRISNDVMASLTRSQRVFWPFTSKL